MGVVAGVLIDAVSDPSVMRPRYLAFCFFRIFLAKLRK